MTNQTEENNQNGGLVPPPQVPARGLWENCLWAMWRTPLGLIGVATTTISIVLMMIGLALDMLGLVENPYFAALCYMILPGFMVLGLLVIPFACWLVTSFFHRFLPAPSGLNHSFPVGTARPSGWG